MSLNASTTYRFRSGVLNGFKDIKPYNIDLEEMGYMPVGPPVNVTECVIIRNNNIYGLGLGFWTVSEIKRYMSYKDGAYLRGTRGRCHWMRLIIRNRNIYIQ